MKLTRSAVGFSALALGAACLLSGCGGATSTSNAIIKSFNAVPNGGTATILASGYPTATVGAFTQSTYANASAGTQTASFTLSSPAITSTPIMTSLNAGQEYTAMLIGRADVASTDPRYPALSISGDDQTTPQSGDCRIRIVQAAPDSGRVDVLVNNVPTSSNTAYRTVTGYSELAAGNATLAVRTSGTSNLIVPLTTISTVGGNLYTIYVTEPTVSSPAYSYTLQQDN